MPVGRNGFGGDPLQLCVLLLGLRSWGSGLERFAFRSLLAGVWADLRLVALRDRLAQYRPLMQSGDADLEASEFLNPWIQAAFEDPEVLRRPATSWPLRSLLECSIQRSSFLR